MATHSDSAVGHVFAIIWLQMRLVCSYLWLAIRTKVLRVRLTEAHAAAVHQLNARRFKDTACRLKGANVKIGQLASMQAHLLPKEVVTELRSLRDAVKATPYPEIAALIEAELGTETARDFRGIRRDTARGRFDGAGAQWRV